MGSNTTAFRALRNAPAGSRFWSRMDVRRRDDFLTEAASEPDHRLHAVAGPRYRARSSERGVDRRAGLVADRRAGLGSGLARLCRPGFRFDSPQRRGPRHTELFGPGRKPGQDVFLQFDSSLQLFAAARKGTLARP